MVINRKRYLLTSDSVWKNSPDYHCCAWESKVITPNAQSHWSRIRQCLSSLLEFYLMGEDDVKSHSDLNLFRYLQDTKQSNKESKQSIEQVSREPESRR